MTVEPPPKPRSFAWLFRWKLWRGLVLVAAVLLTLLALFHAEENWRGKRAWENYRRAMEAKGEVFDFAKFVPPPVPDNENFAMTPALAPFFDYVPGTQTPKDTNAVEVSRFGRTDIAIRKGWAEGKAIDFVALATNHAVAAQAAPTDRAAAAAAVLESLEPYAPVLKELEEASHRPSSRFNVAYNWEPLAGTLLRHYAAIRQACSTLEVRACAELALGRDDAAFQDVQLLFYLVDCTRNEPFMVTGLVRAALLTTALQPVWEGVAGGQWTDRQLETFEQTLGKFSFLEDDQRAIRGERAMGSDYFAELRGARNPMRGIEDTGQSAASGAAVIWWFLMPRGWFYLEEMNYTRMYNAQINDLITPTCIDPAVTDSRSDAVEDQSASGHVWDAFFQHRLFTRILLPAASNFERKMARAQVHANLGATACALERYRLANGQFPDSLDVLAPRFIAAVPPDVIMGQPLKYRRAADGGFILYSVGWNKKDDGGVPPAREISDQPQGDWVWATPGAAAK